MLKRVSLSLTLMTTAMAIAAGQAGWRQAARVVAAQSAAEQAPADGQHDFDFLIGRWKVHSRKLVHPLTGSQEWIEFDGTSVARKVWDGRANMDEFEADSPTGHIEGMTVRLYNPATQQWSLYWASSKSGSIGLPPTVGHFTNGRGEFYDHEEINGKPVLVRFLWLPKSHTQTRWEQAFSVDEGKTWETNWTMDSTRVESSPI